MEALAGCQRRAGYLRSRGPEQRIVVEVIVFERIVVSLGSVSRAQGVASMMKALPPVDALSSTKMKTGWPEGSPMHITSSEPLEKLRFDAAQRTEPDPNGRYPIVAKDTN
jgi:hypothetical protein